VADQATDARPRLLDLLADTGHAFNRNRGKKSLEVRPHRRRELTHQMIRTIVALGIRSAPFNLGAAVVNCGILVSIEFRKNDF
jgi:hypothetical protein